MKINIYTKILAPTFFSILFLSGCSNSNLDDNRPSEPGIERSSDEDLSKGEEAIVENIDPAKFRQLHELEKGQLIDVRTSNEYAAGHLEGAVNIDFLEIATFHKQMAGLDKSKTTYVYCQKGGRSQEATAWMVKNGFKRVYNVNGGIEGFASSEIVR